jgi:hypothetical protein
MPVTTKPQAEKLEAELSRRVDRLFDVLKFRGLKSASEGAGRGSWKSPDDMRATTGSALDVRLAIEDFKVILSEIRGLK